jgi:hypothetical protein
MSKLPYILCAVLGVFIGLLLFTVIIRVSFVIASVLVLGILIIVTVFLLKLLFLKR